MTSKRNKIKLREWYSKEMYENMKQQSIQEERERILKLIKEKKQKLMELRKVTQLNEYGYGISVLEDIEQKIKGDSK